jgi:hypothetical protein
MCFLNSTCNWTVFQFLNHEVPCLNLPPLGHRFDPRSGYLVFVVNKMSLRHVFSEYIGFFCHFSFHQLLYINWSPYHGRSVVSVLTTSSDNKEKRNLPWPRFYQRSSVSPVYSSDIIYWNMKCPFLTLSWQFIFSPHPHRFFLSHEFKFPKGNYVLLAMKSMYFRTLGEKVNVFPVLN